MYNVDLLAAAGVAPPRTHSELLDALRRLARDTDGDGRLDRWAMWATLKTTWYERFYDFYPLYLASSGGQRSSPTEKIVFENEAAVAALEVLRRGFRRGSAAALQFRAGPGSVHRRHGRDEDHRPVVLKELERAQDSRSALRRHPGPRRRRDECRPTATRSPTCAASRSSPRRRHPDAAARFVAYLTSPAADRLLIEEASQLPYRRGLAHDPRFTAALARWPTLSTYADACRTHARHRYRSRHRRDLRPDLRGVRSRRRSTAMVPVRRALSEAAAEAREIVRCALKQRSGWLLAAPYAVFLLAFAAYPICFRAGARVPAAGTSSRRHRSPASTTCSSCATDARFWRAVGNTFVFLAIHLPLQIATALAPRASRSTGRSSLRAFWRAAFFLPVVISGAVVAILWSTLYATDVGPDQQPAGASSAWRPCPGSPIRRRRCPRSR